MTLTLSSNPAANNAGLNLSKASDALRNSLNRLSSGKRIVNSYDDPGGMSVAYKLQSRLRRTEAVRHNVQNGLSFLQVQDGVLASAGNIVSRMSELRTMAQDVTKNTSDIENYSKEFLELQMQLSQMYREKFNGVSLFSRSSASAVSPPNGPVYNKDYAVDEDGNVLTKFSRTIYTHDSGQMDDGNVSIGATNFEDVFNLGQLDTRYVPTFNGQFSNLSNPGDLNLENYPTAGASASSSATVPVSYGSAPDGAAFYPLGDITGVTSDSNNRLINYSGGKLMATDSNIANGQYWELIFRDNMSGTTNGEISLGIIDQPNSDKAFVFDLPDDIWNYSVQDLINHGQGNFAYDPGDYNWGENLNIHFQAYDSSLTNTDIENANLSKPEYHFDLPGVDIFSGSGSGSSTPVTATDALTTPDQNAEVFTSDGYLSSILFVSMGQFTSVIERIADARAENGAEQSRLQMVDELLATNVTNLEAAHGRIMDVDVAMESTKFARYNVMAQASASMVAQANQLTSIALTLLGR